MTGQYRYRSCEVASGELLVDLPLVQVQATRQLNSPGPFQASMALAGLRLADGVTPDVASQRACLDSTIPAQHSVAVFRDDTLVGEWRLTGRPSRKNDGSPVQLTGEWISGALAGAIPIFTSNPADLPAGGYPGPTSTPVGPGTDQLQVAWDLVNQLVNPGTGAPAGSSGVAITLPTRAGLSSGVLLTLTDWPTQQNTALAMLTQIQQGNLFDWDVDVTLVGNTIVRSLTLSYPMRGQDNGVTFLQPEWGGQGGSISDYEANDDGSRIATQVIGVGAGSPPIIARSNTGLAGALPINQKLVSFPSIADPTELQNQTDSAAAYATSTAVPPTVVVVADVAPEFGSYDIGDTVTVNVGPSPSFPYGVSTKLRITSLQITPPVAGRELVTLGVAVVA